MSSAPVAVRLPSTVYDDSIGSLIAQLGSAEENDSAQLFLDFQLGSDPDSEDRPEEQD